MSLAVISQEMVAAKDVFGTISPGPAGLFAGRAKQVAKVGFLVYGGTKKLIQWRKGKDAAEIIGEQIGGKIVGRMAKPVTVRVARQHQRMRRMAPPDIRRKNGIGGRSWLYEPGQYQMVIVYHDANRAGPHVDVHLDRVSFIYRVKPETYAQLRYNNQGYLTEDSKKLLLAFVREEIDNGSFMAQNLDHSKTNARASWVNGDTEGTNYGDGLTRQVISESTVEVYKAHEDGPIEFYAPVLNPHRSMYVYRIFNTEGKKAPICVWGNKGHQPPKFEDRLHLKMLDPDEMAKLQLVADMSTSTAKYDGSSCYIVIDKKGTTVWSPRTSKRTGEQIEYTFMLDGVAGITSDEKIVCMGEIVFVEKTRWPWQEKHYLPCATGSGILNAHAVLPENVQPEIRLYRVDQIGREKTGDLDFWENRELQEQVAALDPEGRLKVVELMSPEEASDRGFEGVVVVPHDGSVNDGYKVKWCTDPDDWRIDRVGFYPGPSGKPAGVLECTSLESGKQFKLGPSAGLSQETAEAMMAAPEAYEGTVLKVESRRGHEGRAAKVVGLHDDKGVAAV